MMNSTGHSQASHTSLLPILENGTFAPSVQDDAGQPSSKRPRTDDIHYCGLCDKSYTERSALVRHETTSEEHCERARTTLNKPYKCQQCSRRFTLNWLRKRHFEEVHQRKTRATSSQQSHAQRTDDHTHHEFTGRSSELQVALSVDHAIPSIDQIMTGVLFSSAIAHHEPRTNDLQEPLPSHQGQFPDIKYRSGTTVPSLVGKDPRSRQLHFPRPCPICQQEFGVTVDDGENTHQHIRKHIKENHAMQQESPETKIMCTECDIQFWYDADLEWHLKSAERYKECGFKFAHAGNRCNGHHPSIKDGQTHEDHRRFKKYLFAWGYSQHGTFARYLGGYAQGNVRTNAPSPVATEDSRKSVVLRPTEESQTAMFLQSLEDRRKAMFRRSTGSLYSVHSQLSWLSTPGYAEYSATVRKPLLPALEEIAPYNAKDMTSLGIIKQTLDSEGDLKYDLASAFKGGQPQEFEQLLRDRGFLENRFTEVAHDQITIDFLERLTEEADNQITTDSLGIQIDATWFHPFPQTRQIECLAILVESGMRISVETVGHFVTAFQNKAVLQYLLAASTHMTITSRLMMCTLCCAIARRDLVAFGNIMDAGVCVSASAPLSTPPLRPFMVALHRQYPRCPYSPSKMGGIKWTTDYILALAIDAKQWAMADRLIKRGAGAYNILVRAAGINDVETLRFLCDQEVHLQSQPCRRALGVCGSADVLHHLAQMMQFSEKPKTVLDVAEYLINRNIDVNARDDRGRTPLEVICSASPNIAGLCASSCRRLADKLMDKLLEKSTALLVAPNTFPILDHLVKRSTVDVGRLSDKYERKGPSTEGEPSRGDFKQLPPFCCSNKDIDRLSSKMEKLEVGTSRTTKIRLAAV